MRRLPWPVPVWWPRPCIYHPHKGTAGCAALGLCARQAGTECAMLGLAWHQPPWRTCSAGTSTIHNASLFIMPDTSPSLRLGQRPQPIAACMGITRTFPCLKGFLEPCTEVALRLGGRREGALGALAPHSLPAVDSKGPGLPRDPPKLLRTPQCVSCLKRSKQVGWVFLSL